MEGSGVCAPDQPRLDAREGLAKAVAVLEFEGPYRAVGPSPVHPIAVHFRASQGRRRK